MRGGDGGPRLRGIYRRRVYAAFTAAVLARHLPGQRLDLFRGDRFSDPLDRESVIVA
jgi:hypothetical protein